MTAVEDQDEPFRQAAVHPRRDEGGSIAYRRAGRVRCRGRRGRDGHDRRGRHDRRSINSRSSRLLASKKRAMARRTVAQSSFMRGTTSSKLPMCGDCKVDELADVDLGCRQLGEAGILGY